MAPAIDPTVCTARPAASRDGALHRRTWPYQNFVGDAFRGATWMGLHNGGGVGWGE
ncbi:MAG: hypothetical protein IPN62_15745 [Flavobacteriales bacterium]|nr:hypothetical protein [Flavobacteriales bacterium]